MEKTLIIKNLNSLLVTQNLDSMQVSCIDPNWWTDSDKLVAEIDEDVDASPMEESVLSMLVTAIDKSKNMTKIQS
jgi:hypothetical protein